MEKKYTHTSMFPSPPSPPFPRTCDNVELCPHSPLTTDVVVPSVLSLVHAVNYLIDLHLQGVGQDDIETAPHIRSE